MSRTFGLLLLLLLAVGAIKCGGGRRQEGNESVCRVIKRGVGDDHGKQAGLSRVEWSVGWIVGSGEGHTCG